jgi:exosortase
MSSVETTPAIVAPAEPQFESTPFVCSFHWIDAAYLLAMIGISPLIWLECSSMWGQKHLQFFPLAWAAFYYFLYTRSGGMEFATGPWRWALGGLLATLSAAAAFESVYISSFWFGYFSGILLVASWLVIRFGRCSVRSIFAMLAMVAVTLRLPSGYDTDLIHLLQRLSSRLLGSAMDGFYVPNVPTGNVFEILPKKLFVDEACSGVDSLYALLACSVFILLMYQSKLRVAIFALPLVFVWASLGNFIRLLLIVAGLEWFGIDLSTGFAHTLTGLIAFLISFGCDLCFITSANALLDNLPRKPRLPEETVAKKVASVFQPSLKYVTAIAFVLSFTYLAFGGVSLKALRTRSIQTFPTISKQSVETTFIASLLPNEIGNWKLRHFQILERERDDSMGHFSAVWQYANEVVNVNISADFPFRGFHRLDFCYTSSGWNITSDLIRKTFASDPNVTVEIRDMKNLQGTQGFLCYSLFKKDGTPAPWKGLSVRGLERLEQTILDPITYQIQILVESSVPLSEEQKESVREIHEKIANQLRPVFANIQE